MPLEAIIVIIILIIIIIIIIIITCIVHGMHRNMNGTSYLRFLQGFVPPLLEVALHVGSPYLSMLCIMSPCYTLQLCQVVSPSLTLPSSRSSALSWLPLGYSLCPSIIIQSGYMPRPFPLLFQYKLKLCPALFFSFLFLCMGLYLLFSNLTSSSPWLFELFSTSGPSLLTMTTLNSYMSYMYLGEHIGRRLVF